MARRKKDVVEKPEVPQKETSQKRMNRLRYGRIDVDKLAELTIEYCENRKADSNYVMSQELAEMILVIVEKMQGGGQYRGYSDDWKAEMTSLAYTHVLKYVHNFKMEKVNTDKGTEAAFSYYAMIIANAFKQSIKQMKKHVAQFPLYNDAIGYDQDAMEQDFSITDSSMVYPDISGLDYGDLYRGEL